MNALHSTKNKNQNSFGKKLYRECVEDLGKRQLQHLKAVAKCAQVSLVEALAIVAAGPRSAL